MPTKYLAAVLCLTLLVGAAACRRNRAGIDKDQIEKSLDQAGFEHNVNLRIDQDKKVVTLTGKVRSQELKDRAGETVKNAAPGAVIANELSVEPVDLESKARSIESNVDDGIKDNLKAALVANRLDNAGIHYDVKNGVVTLNGRVKTPQVSASAQQVAASVPNVVQVVNKITVKQ